MNALLIVDLQKDFLPGGPVPAPHGDRVISPINDIMDKFDLVIASKDWHPEDKKQHFDKWPPHCVQNTEGAEFPEELQDDKIDFVFKKGTGLEDDGYSAFEATNKDLEEYLKERNVQKLFISGLTTEHCVQETTRDAANKGFSTYVIEEAVEGVKADEGDEERAMQQMLKSGAEVIQKEQLDDYVG